MARWQDVRLYGGNLFIFLLFFYLSIIPLTLASTYFTRLPPSVLYVSSGGIATFQWEYHVDNRTTEFQTTSPEWSYGYKYQSVSTYKVIGFDDKRGSWSFFINRATCPPRLLNPDRVSRELPATLVISSVTTADNGIYLCTLKLRVGTQIKNQVQLVVTVLPTFLPSHPSKTYLGIEGQDLKINCTAIGPPTPNITWVNTTDGSVIIMTQGSGSAVLLIDNILRYHAGVYECRAKNNPHESWTKTRTNVTVYYPPEITYFTNNKTVDEGKPVELLCKASGNPSPTITWSRKGLVKSSGTLDISGVSRNDTGDYTCTAKNTYGTAEASMHVTVRYKPSILEWTRSQTINETDPLNLSCTADGYPLPKITWTKSPGTITPTITGGNVYSIPSANRSDGGTYTCTASNQIGNAEKKIPVEVQYKPAISKEMSKNYSSWNGSQVTLKCIVDGLPTPTITWYMPNGQEIKTGVTTFDGGSQVTITTTESRADYGLYKCLAVNDAGRDEHYIKVTQLFPPGPPDVTISDEDIQASSVTVRWIKPDYDGGSPVIDYKVQINGTDPPQEEEHITKTEHTFTGLDKYTKYEIRVYARNVVGYGNASIKTCTTKKRGAPPLPELDLRKTGNAIILNWKKPDENGGQIKSYIIYQKQGVEQNEWKRIIVIHDLSNLTYVIRLEDLEPGQKYWFIVTATNEFGESEKGDVKGEYYNMPKVATSTPTAITTHKGPGKGKHTGTTGNSDTFVIAGAVGAVVLFLIAAVIIVVILRKKNLLGRGIIKKSRSESSRAAYHNDIDPDSTVTHQGAAASLGADEGIPTYAAVDMKKKKKKQQVQNDIPDYAAVDKTKKKRPGEIIYADLAEFGTAGAAAEASRPITYTGTDYADITQFQKQDEPEPTYANFPGRSKNYSGVQGM